MHGTLKSDSPESEDGRVRDVWVCVQSIRSFYFLHITIHPAPPMLNATLDMPVLQQPPPGRSSPVESLGASCQSYLQSKGALVD